MNKAKDYLRQIVKENDKIVLACSGGPDSMALLALLLELKKEICFEIIVCHINHNKREESEAEALMVKDFCLKNQVVFEYQKFEEYEKGNFQEVARKKRYAFFEQTLKKYDSTKLMTAHHGDDLAETILMRLTRGSTLKGYSGFDKETINEWYTTYRPLIYNTKAELLDYVKKNSIPYAIDSSNEEDHYTRNRYRHHILSELKKENPKVNLKLLKYSETISDAANYIEEIVDEKIAIIFQDNSLDLVKFNLEKLYLRRMILKKILSNIYVDDVIYLKEKHIDQIIRAIDNSRPNLEVVLPKKMRVLKRYDKLIFTTEENIKDNYSFVFDNRLEINGHIIEEVMEEEDSSNNTIRLNIEDIRLPLIVRNRLDGDKMSLNNGTKKLKEIFIESKIGKEERDKWPILVDSRNEILWIPGLKKSKYNQPKEKKCDIILKYR